MMSSGDRDGDGDGDRDRDGPVLSRVDIWTTCLLCFLRLIAVEIFISYLRLQQHNATQHYLIVIVFIGTGDFIMIVFTFIVAPFGMAYPHQQKKTTITDGAASPLDESLEESLLSPV